MDIDISNDQIMQDLNYETKTNYLNILLDTNSSFLPKAEYVFRTFCRILGLNPAFHYHYATGEIHVYYGSNENTNYPIRIYHNPESVEFYQSISVYNSNNVIFNKYGIEYIPFLFSPYGPIFSNEKDSVKINKDIIASAFYFLTCWQEYAEDREMIPGDRYDFKESLQYYWDFTEIPVVDRYCNMFLVCMETVSKKFSRQLKWPNKSLFVLTVTHDIDYWNFWTEEHIEKILKYNKDRIKKTPIRSLYKYIGHFITKKLLWNHKRVIKKILRIEKKYLSDSTCFIISGRGTLDSRQNYFQDKKLLAEVKDVLKNSDIGLHGTTIAAFDKQALNDQLSSLYNENFVVNGYRNHYLSFDYQKSFKILEEAGLKFDSTLGFWEHIGFRAGISYPFYPFNIEENRPFRVLEIPLTVMDTTLYSGKAMNLKPLKAYWKIKKLIMRARKNGSHLCFLWHNTVFDPIDYPGWGKLYYKLLRFAYKKDGWICSCKSLYDFWQDN